MSRRSRSTPPLTSPRPIEVGGTLSAGLEFLHAPAYGGRDAVKDYHLTASSLVSVVATTDGPAFSGTGAAGSSLLFTRPLSFAAGESFTVFARFKLANTDTVGGLLNLRDSVSGDPIISLTIGSNGVTASSSRSMYIARDNLGSLSSSTAANGILCNDNIFHTSALRRFGGRIQWSMDGSIWADVGSSPTAAQGAISITAPSASSYFDDPQNPGIGLLAAEITLGGLYRRGLSDSEIAELHRNPRRLFASGSRRRVRAAAGGGGGGANWLTSGYWRNRNYGAE